MVAKMALTSIIVHVPTRELLVAETKRFFDVWALKSVFVNSVIIFLC